MRARLLRRPDPAAPAPGLALAGAALGVLFALPLAYLVSRAVGIDLIGTLRREDAAAPLLRTLVLGVGVAATTSVLAVALAWCTVRTDVLGRRALRLLVPLPLVVPSFVGAFCVLTVFQPGGLLSEVGIELPWRIEGLGWSVAVLTLFCYPYVYLPVAARLAALPRSAEESARSLGRSPGSVVRTVVLPQIGGAVAAGALLVFLYSLAEFGAVSLLRYDTLTRAIYSAYQATAADTAAALSLVLAVVALAVVACEREIARRRRRVESSMSGRAVVQYPLGRARLAVSAAVWGFVLLALGTPVAVLLHWTLRGASRGLDLHTERLGPALRSTAALGVSAALVAVVVVLPIAYLTARHPRSGTGRTANALVATGFALPGVVIGFTFVTVVLRVDLLSQWYQTTSLLVAAYVVHFGVQALRSAQVAVSGVPRRLEDAARSLGAGRLERLVRIELPLMRNGLAAGAGLVLLSVMKELPATLVLRPSDTQTLAVRIWEATEAVSYAEAGLFALVLVALSGVLTWLLTIRSAI